MGGTELDRRLRTHQTTGGRIRPCAGSRRDRPPLRRGPGSPRRTPDTIPRPPNRAGATKISSPQAARTSNYDGRPAATSPPWPSKQVTCTERDQRQRAPRKANSAISPAQPQTASDLNGTEFGRRQRARQTHNATEQTAGDMNERTKTPRASPPRPGHHLPPPTAPPPRRAGSATARARPARPR
jgi:hypothetical protein